ncbi:MAG: isoprenyl transferase [Planctomycetes bacterium]|nr:isoprenyl transferase [Planctomycetota bacterium]
MADISPKAVAEARLSLGLPLERIPRSVAIIMDGNGRWARARGLPRNLGHSAGAKVVRKIVTEAARLGLDALTLYSFSIENWSRPKEEVNALMHLYAEYLVQERKTVMDHNVRLRHLGQREGLPEAVLRELDESVRVSSVNTGMYLCLALNYGSRAEIVDAVRSLAAGCAAGKLRPREIDEEKISDSLNSAGVPDPDLVIRTAGEIRISNFLLWQISYAELYVTDIFWPDFTEQEFQKALAAFAGRHRRFGGVDESNK